jgi:16S rRNA (uracil1498-N3)-methyltransferase
MHRFFVAPEALAQQPVVLTGDQARQIHRVLRLRAGARVILLDGTGWAHEALVLTSHAERVTLETTSRWRLASEPRLHITLFQAVLKGDRFSWVLQKGTEVGISRFVPMVCERNVVSDLAAVAAKRARWERIVREAAEQSGRARLPELAPPRPFAAALLAEPSTADSTLRLIPWEGERARSLRGALQSCNLADVSGIELFVGPEGGFSAEEVRQAERQGVVPVSLGPRILRAETAGLVAAALILYEAGEMEPLSMPIGER